MSRIGLSPIIIPEGVEYNFSDNVFYAKSQKGDLSLKIDQGFEINKDDNGVLNITRPDDDKENNSFTSKKNTIDVVFVLEDEFVGETASEGEKYALVRPVTVGISSENHYAVKSGVSEKEMIVTGGYRVLSKELNHGTLVSVKNDPKKDNDKSE